MSGCTPETGDWNMQFHHAGIIVRDIGPAAQYYVASMGYELCSDIIRDPVQGALVQFLGLPRSPNYLELITPDSACSSLANSLKRGTGLHHICFSTNAIDECLQSLRNRGALILQSPVVASAFPQRRIAWVMDRTHTLLELVEQVGEEKQGFGCVPGTR